MRMRSWHMAVGHQHKRGLVDRVSLTHFPSLIGKDEGRRQRRLPLLIRARAAYLSPHLSVMCGAKCSTQFGEYGGA